MLVTCRTTFYIVNYKWAKTHLLKQIAHPLQAFRPQKIIICPIAIEDLQRR